MADKKPTADNWPVVSGDYIVGDPESPVAVTTLASHNEDIPASAGAASVSSNNPFISIELSDSFLSGIIDKSVDTKMSLENFTPDRFSDRPIFSKVFSNNMIYFSNMMRLFT